MKKNFQLFKVTKISSCFSSSTINTKTLIQNVSFEFYITFFTIEIINLIKFKIQEKLLQNITIEACLEYKEAKIESGDRSPMLPYWAIKKRFVICFPRILPAVESNEIIEGNRIFKRPLMEFLWKSSMNFNLLQVGTIPVRDFLAEWICYRGRKKGRNSFIPKFFFQMPKANFYISPSLD